MLWEHAIHGATWYYVNVSFSLLTNAAISDAPFTWHQ